ncbi:hypothetical protein Pmar_PMAR024469 [Perkinsus marinus ATCC 50983]|uniref:Uncharacterized protein n=1 Tax=Perkinsus marinus (strain ATCC 50983 / TXsc) TaxID=423536 RepID=C5LT23_PERM5|nr:hypothetical protein Pmar_PMAR024469 [Perkinsus marinus ATCC 50983]EEQ99990.1 hypothetical protein Pmar_PMAR024469 [Perkinsus marinus ATCC 50983]|eukprot:XP_002767273.1 hypothetical protein Pmar_PMAR024469 [Perkinsus marinus ATCC 50983]
MTSYPPTGLAPTVEHLPQWIRLGLGDKEYICEEKKATFDPDNLPDNLPDLFKHSSYMAELLTEKPELYDKLKSKITKNAVVVVIRYVDYETVDCGSLAWPQ